VKGYRDQETRLQAVAGRLTTARGRVAELEAKMKDAGGESTRLAKGLAGAQRVVADLEGKLEKGGAELQAYARKLDAAGIDVADLGRAEANFADRLYTSTKRLKEQQAELERVGRARSKMENMQAAGDRMRSAGYGMVGAGIAVGAPIAAATKGAGDFQSQMTDIAQKANLTRAEGERMGQVFDRLGPKVGQLPTKLAEAVDALAGFGLSPKQGEQLAAPLGRAATAYKADILDLSKAAFSGIDNLKVPVSSTARMLDVMAEAGKAGAFEVRDMAAHFPALTASAQALGQKGVGAVADLSAALQITRKGAGDASTAANNLQNLLNKINTEEAIKNFKEFGIDLPKAMKAAAAAGKSPIEAIAELAAKATKGDLSKLSFLFGDAQVQAALRPLIQNLDEYRRIRSSALQAQGTVERDFAERMVDANAKAARFGARMQSLGHRVGNVLLPAAARAMDVIGGLAEKFGAWADRNPELARGLILAGGALAGLLVTAGALAIVVGTLLGPFAMMRFAITAGVPGMLMLGRGLGLVATGFRILTVAMLSNPFIALAVGIGVAAYLIYTKWDKIKATFTAAMSWLGQKWAAFKQVGANLIQGLIDGVMGRIGALKSRILGIAESVKGWFKNALGIKSPSRVFAGFGEFLTQGLAIGVDRGAAKPIARIGQVAQRMASAAAVSAAAITAVPALAGTAPPGSAASRAANATSAARAPVIINIYGQPGQSAEDIAETVRRELDKRERADAAAKRSEYRDDD